MEVNTQICYNGYRAHYKITSLSSKLYRTDLTEFSGIDSEPPPPTINFIKFNQHPIANSDVINVVKDLLEGMHLANNTTSLKKL